MDKILTTKQHDFCIQYIQTGNAVQAALNAGYSQSYSHSRSHELLNLPAVQNQLRKGYQAVTEKLASTYEWKTQVLEKIVDSFMNKSNKTLSAQNAKVVIQAISELNKMAGDYAPDKRLSMTVDTTKERLLEVQRIYEEY